MKYLAALSLLCLLPSIRAAALPQLVGNELRSTSSSSKRDSSGNLIPRSSQPGEILPEAAPSMTDDPSLDPSSYVKRDLSSRSPQGPRSNPGEFTDVGLSNFNDANHQPISDSSSSSSAGSGQDMYNVTGDSDGVDPNLNGDGMGMKHHRHHNGTRYHNGTRHHKWNSTRHEHRKEGILTEFNTHGEHIVVYNGTHLPNGTNYRPANETMNGGKMLGKVVVAGDEVVVYRRPWNETRHHRHHRNDTGGPMPTATGIWLPSGTGWIPSATERPRYHRKVPSAALAGFRGPKAREMKAHRAHRGYEYFSELFESWK